MALLKILKSHFNYLYMVLKSTLSTFFTLIIASTFLLTGCQTTEQAATQKDGSEKALSETSPFVPEWIDPNSNLKTDSTHFSITAMAANVDSARAANMAKSQAKALLAVKLSELSEEQRVQIAEDNPSAADTEFIYHLRRAEEAIAEGASFSKMEVKKEGNRLVAFAKIDIERSAIRKNLKSYFSDQAEYKNLIDSFVFIQ